MGSEGPKPGPSRRELSDRSRPACPGLDLLRLGLFAWACIGATPALAAEPAPTAVDPYLAYIREAPEFRPVAQDPRLMLSRWKTWLYMPWRYRWTIGTGDEGGRFCREFGINGGFTDHGEGPLGWLERWRLPFYNDHTAAKGYLYLNGSNRHETYARYQRDARSIRAGADGPRPIDDAMLTRLRELVNANVRKLRGSPMRAAYALDDEISWGAFVAPIAWRIHDRDDDYARWLGRYYGGNAPRPQYVTPDFLLPQYDRPLGELDFSPLLDRLTYQDSAWANFLGELVTTANRADPETPCGFVGGQAPNCWGGYDYAKLMKKVQFIEAYNLGSSQAIIRSFSPGNALPQVTTHFHDDKRGVEDDIWQAWYYFAHGNRGMIAWVEGWFDGTKPRPWLARFSPTLKEIGGRQGRKLHGARWLHDGIAIYYSHPSIQVSWCLDIEPHRKTWVNRTSADHQLGTSHGVRQAWEDMLTDAGLQYDFLAYDRLVTHGVPAEYRVLILPACYAISDIEARRIEDFCRRGGTVIADFACGLFDQHGKGRSRGVLDALFGTGHDGKETRRDFFSGKLWVETDQDAGYSAADRRALFSTLACRLQDGFAVAEHRLPTRTVREVGKGRAVYLNLSPQRYLQYRQEGTATDALRRVFLEQVLAVARPPVAIKARDGSRPRNVEVTRWSVGRREVLFVVQKAALGGSPTGGNWSTSLVDAEFPVTLEFAEPVADAVDERADRRLGDGRSFTLAFRTTEAVMLSFLGKPNPGHAAAPPLRGLAGSLP